MRRVRGGAGGGGGGAGDRDQEKGEKEGRREFDGSYFGKSISVRGVNGGETREERVKERRGTKKNKK